MSIRFDGSVRFLAAAAAAILLLCGPAAVAQDEGSLRVTASGVGTDVVDRELVGESDTFPEGSQVVFWTKVEGGVEGDVIQHVWIYDGAEQLRVDLGIGGSHWRTYSRKNLHQGLTGAWTVEARTPEGEVLASGNFTCEAVEPEPPSDPQQDG